MESDELAKYRMALEQEWKEKNAEGDPIAASKRARVQLLGLTPAAIASLVAILSSSDNDKLRLDCAKFILSYTIGDKAKIVMPKDLLPNLSKDELVLLYEGLGADSNDIPTRND